MHRRLNLNKKHWYFGLHDFVLQNLEVVSQSVVFIVAIRDLDIVVCSITYDTCTFFFHKRSSGENEWSLYSRDGNLHSHFLSCLTFKLNLIQTKVTWEDRNSLEEFYRSYWSVTISQRDQLLMWDGPGSCGKPMHMGLGCIRKQDEYYPVNNTRNNSPPQFLPSDSCFIFCPDLPQ